MLALSLIHIYPGEYEGLSANYSGAGFSGMRFRFHGLDQQGVDKWIADARASGAARGRDTYLKLEQPSERNPVQRYASVAPGLFDAIVNRCVEPNRMCMKEFITVDEVILNWIGRSTGAASSLTAATPCSG